MEAHNDLSVSGFEASFRGVRLPFGLVLDAVRISGESGRIGSNPFHIELTKPGRVLVSLGAENLRSYLEEESPGGLHGFDISLEGGKLNVAANAKVVVDIRARTICSLEIKHGKELWVVLESVQVMGVGAKSLVEKQLHKLNPVIDLSRFPVDIDLEEVIVSEGEIIAKGSIAVNGFNREPPYPQK